MDNETPNRPRLAEIVREQELTAHQKLYTLRLEDVQALGHCPGQFVEVSISGVGTAPLFVCSSPTLGHNFELYVRSVDAVTDALLRLGTGSEVSIHGPFGRGFPVDEFRGKDLLFAAAGHGLADLRALIHNVLDERRDFGRVTILCGAKNPGQLLFRTELAAWEQREDVDCQVTVDRGEAGWKGHLGVITTLFPRLTLDPQNTVAAIAGPVIMYRFVIMELWAKGVPEDCIYMPLERQMDSTSEVGPVFTYAEVKDTGWL